MSLYSGSTFFSFLRRRFQQRIRLIVWFGFHFHAVITGKENIYNMIRFWWSENDTVGFRFLNLGKEAVAKFWFVVKLNLWNTVLGRNNFKLIISYSLQWCQLLKRRSTQNLTFTVKLFCHWLYWLFTLLITFHFTFYFYFTDFDFTVIFYFQCCNKYVRKGL